MHRSQVIAQCLYEGTVLSLSSCSFLLELHLALPSFSISLSGFLLPPLPFCKNRAELFLQEGSGGCLRGNLRSQGGIAAPTWILSAPSRQAWGRGAARSAKGVPQQQRGGAAARGNKRGRPGGV